MNKEKIIENPYGFIYITTNLINGKRYIGQKKYIKQWKYYLGSGKLLKQAFKKYGRENFKRDIVDIAYSKEELSLKEQQWIKDYNAVESEDFYNITEGGEGGATNTGKKFSEEHKRKMREYRKGKFVGEKHPMYGKHRSEEIKRKISKSRKGKSTKPVIQLDLNGFFIAEFSSLIEAAKQTGIYQSNISNVCNGKRKKACGYKWMYAEEYYKQVS